MARAVLQHDIERRGLQARLAVDSAGTYGGREGEPADTRALRVALARGYSAIAHHRARPVRDEDFGRFDAILAMDHSNLDQLRRRCPPEAQHKLHLFLDYARLGEAEVPDPYREPTEAFEAVQSLCEQASGAVIDRLLVGAAQVR